MPRVIDFTQGNETDWNEVRLPSPVYGEREIRSEEISAIADSFRAPVSGIRSQFSTYGMSIDRMQRSELFDAAHSWLSANATGPWLWTEHWTNHGHHLDVDVFVERIADQEVFAAAHPDLFRYDPPSEHAIVALAIERGAVPRYSANESFSTWSSAHQGFDMLPSDDLGENGMRIVFTHPELEKQFVERWSEKFAVEERDGRKAYVGVVNEGGWRNSPAVWLDRHSAIGSPSGGPTPDGYRWKVSARFDDVAEALERDWGHVFKRKGEADSYAAPYLPAELLALRQGAEAPAFRP